MHTSKIYENLNKILNQRKEMLSSNDSPEKRLFNTVFDYCLNSLNHEQRNIFKKCYVDNAYPFWWMDYYCKSSFYRKRVATVTNFVELFEKIYEGSNRIATTFNLAY